MRFRQRLAIGLTTVTTLGGIAGAAQAHAATLTGTIKAQDARVARSAGLKDLTGGLTVHQHKLERDLRALQGILRHAADAVSAAPAPTPQDQTARRDWATGTRDTAAGVGDLRRELHDISTGDVAGAKRAEHRSLAILTKAGKLTDRADELLGLPPGT